MSETKFILDITGPAMIFATIAGPILAVWASEWRYTRRKKSEKRDSVFRTLITTRASRLTLQHVEALNEIDFAFSDSKYSKVRDAWSLYRKHLRSPDSAGTGEIFAVWQNKANELLDEILYQMALGLKHKISKSEILDNSYRPDAHLLVELDQAEARKLLLEVLRGERAIPFTQKKT